MKIWENYVTEPYERAYRPDNPEMKTEKEVDEDEKGSLYLAQ